MQEGGTTPAIVAAREYLRRGWLPIPIPRGEKAPRLKGWQDLRLRESDLEAYFANGTNVGVLLGGASGGLADVDLDAPEAIHVADALLPLTERIHGRKGKPRSHRWYVTTQSAEPRKFTGLDGTCLVELRSTGQQTVVPPSLHPSGEALRWEREGDPALVDTADLRYAVAGVAAGALFARHWPSMGQRHEAALALHGLLLRVGWSEEEVQHFVRAVALAAGDEEWVSRGADAHTTAQRLADKRMATGRPRLAEIVGREVVDRAWAWLELGRQKGAVEDQQCGLTDLGNAKRFALAYANDVRFCHAWGKWLVWDGQRWVKDDVGEIQRRAKETVMDILLEARGVSDDEKRKKVLAWQKQSEFENRIRALISLAESEDGIPVRAQNLDRGPMLFNCLNGTLDLAIGEFRKHRREDLITKLAPVRFDENAECPQWLQFLARITSGNQVLINFMRRVAGYSLTGDVREHGFFSYSAQEQTARLRSWKFSGMSGRLCDER